MRLERAGDYSLLQIQSIPNHCVCEGTESAARIAAGLRHKGHHQCAASAKWGGPTSDAAGMQTK